MVVSIYRDYQWGWEWWQINLKPVKIFKPKIPSTFKNLFNFLKSKSKINIFLYLIIDLMLYEIIILEEHQIYPSISGA